MVQNSVIIEVSPKNWDGIKKALKIQEILERKGLHVPVLISREASNIPIVNLCGQEFLALERLEKVKEIIPIIEEFIALNHLAL